MRPLSILYVEDNEHLRETIGLMLSDEDREVVLCASGEEALVACASRRFDLVITDVSLPGMFGTELAKQLLAADAARWIVICSGYDLSASVSRLGPNVRALSKPFDTAELDALIDEVTRAVVDSR